MVNLFWTVRELPRSSMDIMTQKPMMMASSCRAPVTSLL